MVCARPDTRNLVRHLAPRHLYLVSWILPTPCWATTRPVLIDVLYEQS